MARRAGAAPRAVGRSFSFCFVVPVDLLGLLECFELGVFGSVVNIYDQIEVKRPLATLQGGLDGVFNWFACSLDFSPLR